jgi:putative PIN family toxin of toxin-antitoxin system
VQVVVDTNVIVSGIIKINSIPAEIVNLIINGKLTLNLDARILNEYRNVLQSPKFPFPEPLISDFIDFIEKESYLVSPLPLTLKMIDNGDLPFIEVAFYRNVPIITGNKRYFNIKFDNENAQELVVYSPKEFLNHFKL